MYQVANPNQIKQSKAILSIHLTSNSGTFEINNQFPQQNLRLCQYRIQMTSDAVALSQQVVYFDCNLFNNASITSDRLTHFGIPIHLDGTAVTVAHPDFSINTSQAAQKNMNFSIKSYNGSLVTNLVSLTLTFEYDLISTGN